MKKLYSASLITFFIYLGAAAQNVGIGIATPQERLHIMGSVRGDQSGAVRISTGNGYIDVGPQSASWSHFYTDRPAYFFNKGIRVDEGLIGSYDEDLQLGTSGTTRITALNSNGNVGIGTVTPAYKLHVLGGSQTAISAYTDGYMRDMSGRLAGNLISSHCWNIGTSSVCIYSANEDNSSENVREWGDGPHNQRALLWKAVPSGNGNADGGWNTQTFEIDHTKTYRATVWIKKTGDADGDTYFGIYDNSVKRTDGTDQGNPYFWCGDLPEFDKWYLLVGYIYGSGDVYTQSKGGIYDGVTGQKVISYSGTANCSCDFKFTTSSTLQQQRAYLYYNGNSTNRQYFWDPRFEEVNGHEPTIAALLGNAAASIGISGTTNYVSKFTSATTIGNSQIFDNGTNVAVGHNAPAQKLDVNGVIKARQGMEVNAGDVTTDNNYGIYFNGSGDRSYAIYRESGSWSYPYPDLRIGFHTGIKLGANANYNGIRFYTDYDMSGLVMSVNDASTAGAGNVYMSGNLGVGSTTLSNRLQVGGSVGVYDDAQNTDSRYMGEVIERGWSPSSNISYVQVSDAPVGNIVARTTTYTWVYGPKIALDKTKDYLVEGWVRYTSGSPATWYFCVQNYDANGSNLSGDGTDWHYPVSGATPPATWTKYSFVVGPNGIKNHNSSAKFISVGWIANYSTGNATYEFCGWKIKPINSISSSAYSPSYATSNGTSEILLTGNNTGSFSLSDRAGWTPGTWQSTGVSITKNITAGNFALITVSARIEGDNYNRCVPSSSYFRITRGGTEIGRSAVNMRASTTNPTEFYYFISTNLSMQFIDSGVSGSQTYTLEYWLCNDNGYCSAESVQLGERYLNIVEFKP